MDTQALAQFQTKTFRSRGCFNRRPSTSPLSRNLTVKNEHIKSLPVVWQVSTAEVQAAMQECDKPTEKDHRGTTMEMWSSWCTTSDEMAKAVRPISNTDRHALPAQYKRRQATERWGPEGIGWGIEPESVDYQIHEAEEGRKILFYKAVLFYTEWSNGNPVRGRVPIQSSWDARSADCFKSVATDALTKGLAGLGMNSDIFEGRFNASDAFADNKYMTGDMTDSDITEGAKPLSDESAEIINTLVNDIHAVEKEMGVVCEPISKRLFAHLEVEDVSQIPSTKAMEVINQLKKTKQIRLEKLAALQKEKAEQEKAAKKKPKTTTEEDVSPEEVSK